MQKEGIPYYLSLTTEAGAGDHICFTSACREFIRRTGNTVYMDKMPDLLSAYHDPRLLFGNQGVRFQVSPGDAHREKESVNYVNYYGTYLASMGLMRKGDDPVLDLPIFEESEPFVLLQPIATYAKNPPVEYVQSLVDTFRKVTGMDIFVIGRESTPRVLKNVRYDFLQDSIPHLMRLVQSAAFVLSPRSLTAHLAAGYHRPAFIWVPDDGENWHLNYTGWKKVLHNFKEREVVAGEILKFFLKNLGKL